jgi:metal-sulfur cluster biosynthetic enzyme
VITKRSVDAALGAVIDPELDEPITALRFVRSVEISDGGEVGVVLRLPTPQCAPNFAFMMAADARDSVRRLPGVTAVTVTLEDHYTGAEINAAVAKNDSFGEAFPGETERGDLEALRELFRRKALIARESIVCEQMLADGASAEAVVNLAIADVPDGPERTRCLQLRRQLGIRADPAAPAFVRPDGSQLSVDDLRRWLRVARLTRTSLEANGGICRSIVRFRHHAAADTQEVAL